MAPKMIKFAAAIAFAPAVTVFASDDMSGEADEGLMVNLVSNEGESFQVSKKAAGLSELAKTMFPIDDEDEIPDIPLPNVKSAILGKVIEFMTHYVEEPMSEIEKPLKSTDMAEVVQDFYANYVDVEQETLFELILAANYLDIQPLLDLTCATVASKIKGKTPEDIRKQFNINGNGTNAPAEEEETKE